MTSASRTIPVTVLPDSGADISAAGQALTSVLGLQVDNLTPSEISPRAVKGASMKPLGKIPVTISLQGRNYKDDIHIFPGVSGALILWQAARELGILPPQYPHPERDPQVKQHIEVNSTEAYRSHKLTIEELTKEFQLIFSGQITTMHGEFFKISLIASAEPFYVKAPCSILLPTMRSYTKNWTHSCSKTL